MIVDGDAHLRLYRLDHIVLALWRTAPHDEAWGNYSSNKSRQDIFRHLNAVTHQGILLEEGHLDHLLDLLRVHVREKQLFVHGHPDLSVAILVRHVGRQVSLGFVSFVLGEEGGGGGADDGN